MKITFETRETKSFKDLRTGDVFTINGKVFIKTDQPEDPRTQLMKAVNLSTGEMTPFWEDIHVHTVDAELIVR